MASDIKSYAYYIKGNKIALVQRNSTDSSASGEDYHDFKSPTETVADALEVQYTYTPDYFINETDDVDTQIDTYVSLGGLLKLIDTGDNDYSASPESLSDGSHIVLENAGQFNGLHKVKDVSAAGSIVLYTKYSGSASVQKAFEEPINLYYNVSALIDETHEIDLSSFLTKAAVYYVKAKFAEDAGNIDLKEYFMKEYRKILDRHDNSKITGIRRMSAFGMKR